jgi:hypothetical protein
MPSVENSKMFYRQRSKREFGGNFVLITDGLSDVLTGTYIAFPGVKFHDRTSKSTVFVALPFLIHKLFIVIPRLTESYITFCS